MSSLSGSLSGNMICQLPSAASVISSDLLLVSKGSESNAVTYSTLLSQLSTDLKSSLSLGTMAWENKYKYSLTSHNHDELYSKVSIDGTINPDDISYEIAIISAAVDKAHMDSGEGVEVRSIYARNLRLVQSTEPPIGMLKFLYRKTPMGLVDSSYISADDFDGWVYPDGTTFTVTDYERFKSAIQAYGSTAPADGEYHFTVPDLKDSFFELASGKVANLDEVSQMLCIGIHDHEVRSMMFNGDLKPASGSYIKTYAGKHSSKKNGHVHYGDTTGGENKGIVPITINLKQVQFIGLPCGTAGDSSVAFVPKNNALPTMIYIGGIKRS